MTIARLALLFLVFAMAAVHAAQPTPTFVYDATGLRDPMVRPLFVAVTNGPVTPRAPHTAQARRADIERAVLAARIEGVAISSRARAAIINDRLVREGDPLVPGQAVRVLRIERDRIVFVLDTETYDFYLTPVKELSTP